jgi:hypothetical protein
MCKKIIGRQHSHAVNRRIVTEIYQGIIMSVYVTHLLIIYFIFSDVIATCFGLLSGHHQVILTEMYYETSFYNGAIVSLGIKNCLVVYTVLFNLES